MFQESRCPRKWRENVDISAALSVEKLRHKGSRDFQKIGKFLLQCFGAVEIDSLFNIKLSPKVSSPFPFEKRIKLACIKNESVTNTPAIPTPLAQQSVFLLIWMVIGVATKRRNEGHGERASLSSGECSDEIRVDKTASMLARNNF